MSDSEMSDDDPPEEVRYRIHIDRPHGSRSGFAPSILRSPSPIITPPLIGSPREYDRNLTPAHMYMGDRFKETSGRTILEDNKIHILPVIFLKLNLIPGQILPIIACTENVKSILRYAHAKDELFGVSYQLNEGMPTFGTIAAIQEFSIDIDTGASFQVKAIGHQRYQILEINRFSESHNLDSEIVLANIKIINNIVLTHPYNKLCLHPKKRSAGHSVMCRKRDMWQTPWPEWVYEQFDIKRLAARVTQKLRTLYGEIKIPDDPALLSFSIMKMGIFDELQVSLLLGVPSANERLLSILRFWDNDESLNKFMCSQTDCLTIICNMRNIFQMSPEGPQGTYCNSWGHLHDMITVTELDPELEPLSLGYPSAECSWFPGYKWTVILCPNCRNHLGWRFVVDRSVTLVPRVFYGLCMQSITPAKEIPGQILSELDEIHDVIMMDIEF